MDETLTPSKTLHRQFPAPLIPQSYGKKRTQTVPSSASNLWTPNRHRNLHGKQLDNLMLLCGNSLELRVLRPFLGKNRRHHCLSRNAYAIVFSQSSIFPFLNVEEEILSGYAEDVSFIRDGFTTWVKADFYTILERHAVDFRMAVAEFREASARRHDTSSQEYHFDSNVPNRSSVQKRLSNCNWNPGP